METQHINWVFAIDVELHEKQLWKKNQSQDVRSYP